MFLHLVEPFVGSLLHVHMVLLGLSLRELVSNVRGRRNLIISIHVGRVRVVDHVSWRVIHRLLMAGLWHSIHELLSSYRRLIHRMSIALAHVWWRRMMKRRLLIMRNESIRIHLWPRRIEVILPLHILEPMLLEFILFLLVRSLDMILKGVPIAHLIWHS